MSDEYEFTIGGRTFAVRPTFKIIRRLENFGAPIAIAKRLGAGEIGLVEMSGILRAIVQDQPDAPTQERIGDALIEDGPDKQVQALSDFIVRLWQGSKAGDGGAGGTGEVKAAPTLN